MKAIIKAICKLFKMCDHNHVVVYQDNSLSLERCTKCGDEVKYGGG